MAAVLVRPLAALGVSPNAVTAATVLLAVTAACLFARADATTAHWAAGLFVLARFLDHCDGVLARATGRTSPFGHHFDYIAGAISYGALFIGIGIGFSGGALGPWPGIAGVLIGSCISVNMTLRVRMEAAGRIAGGYPGAFGFELEDGIYLIAPATWLGWLGPFFVLAAVGAAIFCLWTVARFMRDTGGQSDRRDAGDA